MDGGGFEERGEGWGEGWVLALRLPKESFVLGNSESTKGALR